MKGTAMSIQSTKDTRMPCSASAPIAIAFGGVPTGVPMPPTLAASGIDSATPARALPAGSVLRIGMTTANIVAVVAVFDMNMLSTAVISMSPSTVRRALSGKGRNMIAARLRSSPNFSAPCAIMNPPRKRMMTGWASAEKYADAGSSWSASAGSPPVGSTIAPSESKRTSSRMTSTAVAVSGTGSSTQKTMASRKIDSIRCPGVDKSGIWTKKGMRKQTTPKTRPTNCFLLSWGPLLASAGGRCFERRCVSTMCRILPATTRDYWVWEEFSTASARR